MNIFNKYKKLITFIILLSLSNLYLFKSGYWFAQDTSYWPKNSYESLRILMQQFQVFTNFGYYLGFDQGLFNFTRILLVSIISLFSITFGFSGSQVAFSLIGFIATFLSFYLFSRIFFKNINVRFTLSLLYTFNPLSYTLQGYALYNAAVPLFLYSYYKYFYDSAHIRISYLLINILSSFIWISYIRFLQSNFFVILPYLIYLFLANKNRLSIKKLAIFGFSYILVFTPIIYSFASQLLEKSQTAFFYGDVLGKFVVKERMINTFNFFQAFGMNLYEHNLWPIAGIIFLIAILILFITNSQKAYSRLSLLNLSIILISMTLYGLGHVTGDFLYLNLIHLFPFIINAPFFALFILNLPLAVLLGLLTEHRKFYLYVFSSFYIILSTIPLLNLKNKNFINYQISHAPTPYKEYFVDPYSGISESTYYPFSPCWRAKYMENVTDENICLNFGIRNSSATLSDPRLISGERYKLAQLLSLTTATNNLRITHNLKNIILPKDLVKNDEIKKAAQLKMTFNEDSQLTKKENENFIHYSFIDNKLYDFFIYSPKEIVYRNNIGSITDNSLKVQNIPVVLKHSYKINTELQSVKTTYKTSPLNATKYYLYLSEISNLNPFIIQFNQDYNPAWKIKIVDKAYFDKKKCISKWEVFKNTNNQRCPYKSRLLELDDIRLLNKPDINQTHHVQTNFVNNGWIITSQNNQDLYAVIINEKQIYYNIAILAFAGALTTLITIAAFQELKYRIRNK